MAALSHIEQRVCILLADSEALRGVRRYCLEEPEAVYKAFTVAIPSHPPLPHHITSERDGLSPDERLAANCRFFWQLEMWVYRSSLQREILQQVGMRWASRGRRGGNCVEGNGVVRST